MKATKAEAPEGAVFVAFLFTGMNWCLGSIVPNAEHPERMFITYIENINNNHRQNTFIIDACCETEMLATD